MTRYITSGHAAPCSFSCIVMRSMLCDGVWQILISDKYLRYRTAPWLILFPFIRCSNNYYMQLYYSNYCSCIHFSSARPYPSFSCKINLFLPETYNISLALNHMTSVIRLLLRNRFENSQQNRCEINCFAATSRFGCSHSMSHR